MTFLSAAIRRIRAILKGRDKGSVAIQFVLVLPLLMVIVGVIVQFGLLVNAHFTLRRAIAAAARSAMVSLPTDQVIGDQGGQPFVERSALMVLTTISPMSRTGTSYDGTTVMNALVDAGLSLPDPAYAQRYTFAQQATVVSITPLNTNFAQRGAATARVAISYKYLLKVPLVDALVGTRETIAGVSGWYTTITTYLDVQLSPGRETIADPYGDPVSQ